MGRRRDQRPAGEMLPGAGMVLEGGMPVGLGRVPGIACLGMQRQVGEPPGGDLGPQGGTRVGVSGQSIDQGDAEATQGQGEDAQPEA